MTNGTDAKLQARIEVHTKALQSLLKQSQVLERICEALVETFRAGGRVWLAGNGGSAADASHVAAELMVRFKHDRQPLPAMAVPAGGAVGTAIANDLACEEIFGRQLEAMLSRGDLVWLFSTSGRSRNVVRAAMAARNKGCRVILFTGPNDSPLARLADLVLHADGPSTDIIQEVHEVAYHYICEQVEKAFVPDESEA